MIIKTQIFVGSAIVGEGTTEVNGLGNDVEVHTSVTLHPTQLATAIAAEFNRDPMIRRRVQLDDDRR